MSTFMLAYPTRLESGPWFAAGTRLDGETVQRRLETARLHSNNRPYSVYVHVPFCGSICSFCALYTRAVAPDDAQVLDEYLECVTESLASHPWAHRAEPPTTVHFGGGTPLFLGLKRFSALVGAVRDAFGTSASCEWAIETTTSSLDPETVEMLASLGFQRIHLGIQTLHDETRRRVGRHETGAKAVERISALESQGFFTSVDLIVGFEGVGLSIVEDDLRRLYDAGVRMFSICELRERGTTRLGVRDVGAKARETYAIWRGIWDFMASTGLKPIHLGQFARTQEENLYFTHPARGEDCVAIGPYAHGSSGHMYFGNLLMPEYYDAIRGGRSPIGSGIEYGEPARAIRLLERELLAHRLSTATLDELACTFPGAFPPLLASWIDKGLVTATADTATLTLDGSWFVGNMVFEARALAERTAQVYPLRQEQAV